MRTVHLRTSLTHLADFILGKSRSLRLLKSSSLPEARAPETRVFDMTGNSPIKNAKM